MLGEAPLAAALKGSEEICFTIVSMTLSLAAVFIPVLFMGGVLGRLFAVAEAYPNLKADQSMNRLMEELTSTENKVAFARQAYNDSVMAYNTQRETFPTNMVAGPFNFGPAELFVIEKPAEKEAPKVTF